MQRPLLVAATLVLGALTAATWFAGTPSYLPPAIPAGALLALILVRLGIERPRIRPLPEVVLCAAATVVYRLPALLHPWGFVNRDGAYGAYVALHILQGVRPAPVFTEGADYQGTLKGHMAALLGALSGVQDLSWLMEVASIALYVLVVVATMSIARRVGGRAAGVGAGLYLALSPRFLTIFSLNCTGQYMDIFGLGMAALAVLGPVVEGDPQDPSRRTRLEVAGLLLGLAIWQQPAAAPFVVATVILLALRLSTWRDPWSLVFPLGLGLGVLPVVLWNLRHGWATTKLVGTTDVAAQVETVHVQAWRTLSVSLPILGGLASNHPRTAPNLALALGIFFVLLFVFYVAFHGREIVAELRRGEPTMRMVPPLLFVCVLAIVWSAASGRVYARPRYLLALMGPLALFVGFAFSRLIVRARALGMVFLGALVCLNVWGSVPRLVMAAQTAEEYRRLVDGLLDLGIRTGHSDFSISAPVTMFTRERITLSPALGPTPAYYSRIHEARIERNGPDAYVLLPQDDAGLFAAYLKSLGVSYRYRAQPTPVFYGFSRRVDLGEVMPFRSGVRPSPPSE